MFTLDLVYIHKAQFCMEMLLYRLDLSLNSLTRFIQATNESFPLEKKKKNACMHIDMDLLSTCIHKCRLDQLWFVTTNCFFNVHCILKLQ